MNCLNILKDGYNNKLSDLCKIFVVLTIEDAPKNNENKQRDNGFIGIDTWNY